jgi:two-component system, LuxR family, response regulator FixJ
MANEPTVFVVDDDPGALRSLCWLVQQAHLRVRGFHSGREFLKEYHSQQLEGGCMVLDVRMPEMDGLEVQQRLWEDGIGVPIIFITAYGDVPTCVQALKAGALEFLEKPVDHAVLLNHIRNALARSAEYKQHGKFAAGMSMLTASEKEVFDLLVSGKSLKEIASIRNVTVQTIWKHRLSILQKVGVESDLELIRVATQWTSRHRK